MTDDPRRRRRSGTFHDIAGAAPARSALTMRIVLAWFGLAICAIGAVAFAANGHPVIAGLLAIVALTAVADLVVIRRRRR